MTAAIAHPPPAAHFWDKIARKYAAKPVADPVAYEEKLTHVKSLIHMQDRVLEIGCGTGTTALHLSPYTKGYTGADISGAMIEIAERKCFEAGTANLRFVTTDAAEPVPGAPFDVVMAFSLLHLVANLPRTLAAVHDQVKPDGLFISKTVCLGDVNIGVRFFVRSLRLLGIAPPISFLTATQLRWALIEAGFEIVEQRYFGKGRYNPFFVARRPA